MELEVLGHAYMDFLAIDLDIVMDTGSKESRSGFKGQEEIVAHDESDSILDELSTKKQVDSGQQG